MGVAISALVDIFIQYTGLVNFGCGYGVAISSIIVGVAMLYVHRVNNLRMTQAM